MTVDPGDFYLGRSLDTGHPVAYDPDDLTTHGVIVGMTGSGKTGLGVDLIEEALLNGIPCLVIDPKGDMGNLALNFPELTAADLQPWIDEAVAAKEGKTVAEAAASTAEGWKRGLQGHDIDSSRMRKLKDGSEITIYTPGSSAGVSLNVLGSMRPPNLDWDTHSEVIREEIQSLVSSLLVLTGISSDPVSGPEHILLSTIIETVWRQGKPLDLAGLVGQIPRPPFRKLGVFDVDSFIPEKDRMALALSLNGLLASPSFSSWLEGTPLDIESMIGSGDKTRAAIVYLSHLSDEERQFLVTLLLSKMVTWIRSQPGTARLRALIYMDEVFGFAPPTAAPPSKQPILTILKQARAHGVGMVLSTQNPVDLDYKAMSNAGTWMVGRLQTENDKKRILEGLKSASGSIDISVYDKLITGLGKREFVLHSIKQKAPVVFGTRWAISYLAGPLTRDQVSVLMADRRPTPVASARDEGTTGPAVVAESSGGPFDEEPDTVLAMPKVAEGVRSYYLDPGAPWAGEIGADPTSTVLEPAVAVAVELLYDNPAADINHRETYEAVIFPIDGVVDESDVITVDHDDRDFLTDRPENVGFRIPTVRMKNKDFWNALERDLKAYLVAHRPVTVLRNPDLKLYSRIDESSEAFHQRCRKAAEEAADIAIARLTDRYKARIDRVKDQIDTAETRLDAAEVDVSSRQQREIMAGAGELLGALLGGRRRSNPLGQLASRRSQTQRAQAKVATEAQKLSAKEQELADFEEELAAEVTAIVEEHTTMAENVEEAEVKLKAVNVRIVDLKLVWFRVGGS